ncbi:AfsA-related hotdog domain-containing protein [Pyxidicoccus sp. 3LG]
MVGDGFAGFASENPDVITISELERRLASGGLQEELTLTEGQGISRERRRHLRECVARAQPRLHLQSLPEPAGPKLVHKRAPENVMISIPERVGEDLYHACLVVDDRCAEMSDHTTGQHLQGMLLMEAGRQMSLAVTEHYFLQQKPGRSNFFVINRFELEYLKFAFPVRTEMECQLRWAGRRRLSSNDVRIALFQGGECIADGCATFATYDASMLRTFEAAKARELLTKLSSTSCGNG